jgi:hypothetical protein
MQLQQRKRDLITNTDQLSHQLKTKIETSTNQERELKAVENLVREYEKINNRNMTQIETYAQENILMSQTLDRRHKLQQMKDTFDREVQESTIKL